MTLPRSRPGLSFELAPPPATDPLRTDVACFVGTVARRAQAVAAGPVRLPPVLVRWLQAQGLLALGGMPLSAQRALLGSVDTFAASLIGRATEGEAAAWTTFLGRLLADAAARAALEALLQACRTLTPVPDAVIDDLRLRGWSPKVQIGGDALAGWLRVQRLHNLPLRVDSFESFDALFAWDRRPVMPSAPQPGDPVVACALGAALRAFFGEGGQLAYVVRCGDPSRVFDTAAARFDACFGAAADDRCAQLSGVRNSAGGDASPIVVADSQPAPLAADDWAGIEHVFGLPEVSFLLLPDLADACARTLPREVPPPAEVVAAPEHFVPCADAESGSSPAAGRRLPPPRLDDVGLEAWRQLVLRALGLLDNGGRAFHRRDVELLASLPLATPGRDQPEGASWLDWMQRQPGWLGADARGAALLDDRLQLAHPWLASRDSADTPGGVEAPEGTLAGVLARHALLRGAYRSAALQPLRRFIATEPAMAWAPALQQPVWTGIGALSLAERVCLLGPSPRGPVLLSDVTCSGDARTRHGAVRRLVNVVVQAARRIGDEFAFEPSGELLWAHVRERLCDLMRALSAAGALSGDAGAFEVRCGRDTMRQSDIDAGRLIAEVALQPALPIRRIVVMLNLRDSGAGASFAAAA